MAESDDRQGWIVVCRRAALSIRRAIRGREIWLHIDLPQPSDPNSQPDALAAVKEALADLQAMVDTELAEHLARTR
jgi:hypothetical protein